MDDEPIVIPFEEARQIVLDQIGSRFPAEADFTVAPWGWESEEFYILDAGPYAMVHGPRSNAELKWIKPGDQPAICVHKQTGEIARPENPPQPNTPCGEPYPGGA